VRERHAWEDHEEFLETLPDSGMFTRSGRISFRGAEERWAALGRAAARRRREHGSDGTWVVAVVVVLIGLGCIVAGVLGAGR
jgi:hypothetical protein